MATASTMNCPVCQVGHALTVTQVGAQTLYRCLATRQVFVLALAEGSLPLLAPAEPDQAARLTETLPLASTARTAANSWYARASVMEYLQQSGSQTSAGPATPTRARYELGARLAQGGMGVVWEAADVDLARQVAMKTLLPRAQPLPGQISQFIQEARTIGQLEHPNIVPIYDVGVQPSGEVYFTMKLVRGQTLDQIISGLAAGDAALHANYTWQRRVQILQQIADALAFAHGRQIIHRDLKPANVMIGEFGEVQLMDWGIAKRLNEVIPASAPPADAGGAAQLVPVTAEPTRAGSLVGTLYYMSPEQAQGMVDKLTPASDIYALGAVMYELLGLRKAHEGETPYAVLLSVVNEDPQALYRLKSPGQGTVPVELEHIRKRAMAKDPAHRIADATAFRIALQHFLDGTCPLECPQTALKGGVMRLARLVDNHGAEMVVGVVAVGVAVVAGVLWYWLT